MATAEFAPKKPNVVLTMRYREAQALWCLLYRHVEGHRALLDSVAGALDDIMPNERVYHRDGGTVFLKPIKEGE